MSVPLVLRFRRAMSMTPDDILDLASWPSFQGYGPVPGIVSAEFEVRTPEVLGSRIRVRNTDGSTHLEEVVVWDPPRRLQIRMSEFRAPLSWLASHFLETWDFREGELTRTMALHPRSVWTRPLLWLVSLLLRRALDRQLRLMSAP